MLASQNLKRLAAFTSQSHCQCSSALEPLEISLDVMPGRQSQAASARLGRRLAGAALRDSFTSSDSDSPAVVELFVQRQGGPESVSAVTDQGTSFLGGGLQSSIEQFNIQAVPHCDSGVRRKEATHLLAETESAINTESVNETLQQTSGHTIQTFTQTSIQNSQVSLQPSNQTFHQVSLQTCDQNQFATQTPRLSIPLSPMLALHRCRLFDWSPTPVVALTPTSDGAYVAAARESGDIELWRAAAGALGWQCERVIPGVNGTSVTSLVWLKEAGGGALGRLFSAGLHGRITEWDLSALKPKATVDSYGGPVWALAAEPPAPSTASPNRTPARAPTEIASSSDDSDSEEEEGDDLGKGGEEKRQQRIAVACDDGCARLFAVDEATDELQYAKALPRVEGRILSVAWGQRANQLFSGGSDGCIRAWDVATSRELVRITAGIGGQKKLEDLCVWALLSLRDGTLVSGDSSGSTQFWDGEVGTLLQAQKRNQGDVLALASPPQQDVVFAAGIDGLINMYQRSSDAMVTGKAETTGRTPVGASAGERWVHVGGRRSHTHDVRALAIALPRPITEDLETPQNQHRKRSKNRLAGGDSLSLALRSPMLVSGGNDALLFTYPANSFMAFHPFCFSPLPQSPRCQLSPRDWSKDPQLLVQHPTWLDIWQVERGCTGTPGNANPLANGGPPGADVSKGFADVKTKGDVTKGSGDVSGNGGDVSGSGEGRKAKRRKVEGGRETWVGPGASFAGAKGGEKLKGLEGGETVGPERIPDAKPPVLVARIKKSGGEHILCSAIAPDGRHVACSDWSSLRLFELGGGDGEGVKVSRVKLPESVPAAHCVVFSGDSKRLIVAATRGGLLVFDWAAETVEEFRVPGGLHQGGAESPPVLHMATCQGDKWLAVADSSSCIRVYNLERLKLHWTLPPLDGFLPTALSFHPAFPNHLFIATSANQLHAVDVRAKSSVDLPRLGGPVPQQLLEFPGGITGLSVDPAGESLGLVAYGPKAFCFINLKSPPTELEPVLDLSPSTNKKKKSKRKAEKTDLDKEANGISEGKSKQEAQRSKLRIVPLRDPCLFVGHLGPSSLFLAEKPWAEVVSQFPPPLYRHKYGT